MKKIVIIFLIAFLTAPLLNAGGIDSTKKTEGQGFHFGLKVSPAISWLKSNNKNIKNDGNRLNVNGGLILDFNFTDNYAFSTGFEISSFGGKFKFDSITLYTDAEDGNDFLLTNRIHRFRYVTVPLALKLKTNQIGAMVYYGQFGFDMGMRWRALADDEGSKKGIKTNLKDVDIQKDVSFLRLALNVGLGVEYNLAGNTSLLIAANYNNGFLNAFRKESRLLRDADNKWIKQDAFANYVALSVGVLF